MLTEEEVLVQGFKIMGTGQESPFVISSNFDRRARNNVRKIDELQDIFNNSLDLEKYAFNKIENITITLMRPYEGKGVNWLERKLFKRKQKKLIIDVIFDKYKDFCNADKQKALSLLAEQILKAVENYMPKIKELDYNAFHSDLTELFRKEKLIGNN